jgi:GNAT superfamily N-acetyltransferase
VHQVRFATTEDAEVVGQMLHDFNTEYEDVTPPPGTIAERLRRLLADGDTVVLLGGDGPDGLALMRFRPSLWVEGAECYLAELYVRPGRRGRGLGRAIMNRVLEVARDRGAGYIELNTGERDTAARRLYESLGFVNDGGNDPGELNIYYEKELP